MEVRSKAKKEEPRTVKKKRSFYLKDLVKEETKGPAAGEVGTSKSLEKNWGKTVPAHQEKEGGEVVTNLLS